MSTSWQQKNARKVTIQSFVDKAIALRPILSHRKISPKRWSVSDKEFSAASLSEVSFGRGDSCVIDFGSHCVGYLTITVDAHGGPADAPAFIKVKMCEHQRELDEDSSKYNGWLGKGWLQEEWIHIDEFPAELHLPRRYALRYLKLDVIDTSPNYKLQIKSVYVDAVTSAPDADIPSLNTDDAMLQKIDEVCIRTLRDCMQEVFEDGPKRDRRLWLGDLRLQATVNAVTFKNYGLVKRCLYLFAGLKRDDGMIGSCLYAEPRLTVDNIFLLDYSLFFVSTLLDYYRAAGDTDTLNELTPAAIRQIELAKQYIQPNGIIEPESRYNCFIDWKDGLDKQTSMQGIWLYTLRCGSALCCEAGYISLAQQYDAEYENGKEAALNVLWDDEKKLFVSGDDRQISFASQIWMCIAGVAEGSEAVKILERVYIDNNALGIVTPYLFHHYVLALIESGAQEKALDEIKRYWGGMIDSGADTFWELFEPNEPYESPYGSSMVNSYCHAWSCTPSYLLRCILS